MSMKEIPNDEQSIGERIPLASVASVTKRKNMEGLYPPQETTDMVDATTKGTIDRTMLLAMGTMIGIPTH